MGKVESALEALGLELPAPKVPVANYLGTKESGKLLFVSGRVSQTRGEVGTELDTAEAKLAARDAMLDVLAIVRQDIGDLDRIESVEKRVTRPPRDALPTAASKRLDRTAGAPAQDLLDQVQTVSLDLLCFPMGGTGFEPVTSWV